MKQICFILDSYPTKVNNGCVFARHLICAIADKGFDCVVIAPAIKNTSSEKIPYSRSETTANGSVIRVFTPSYIHFSSRKQTIKLSMNSHFKSVMKTIKKEDLHPDVVYGHFIYQCGLTAARLGKKLGVPAYCACGENSLRLMKGSEPYATGLKNGNWKEILSSLSGIVSVSEYNKTLLKENGFVSSEMPIGVFPNGFNKEKFFAISQSEARKQLGLPENRFIAAFTGAFKESKGITEFSEALKLLPDVSAVIMGKGSLKPVGDNILFCDSVPNDKLYLYLNAADVFVLPTKGEGCCNAIIEALACGLPVISSNLPFNDGILDDTNSIRVDVNDVAQIQEAVKRLKTDEVLLRKLSKGAACSAEKLDINVRAENILRFMELS